MITDPVFYAIMIPAILLVGIAKGGFCAPLSMLGVPIAALVISPVQAAAIFLPILLLMDFVALYSYRGTVNWSVLKAVLPFAFVGIFLGWLLADMVSDDAIRLALGLTTIAFVVDYVWRSLRNKPLTARGPVSAALCGTATGFTSFVAHAGNPPYQIYTLPLGMKPVLFAGTMVHAFTILNLVKSVPYFALGQFTTQNLTTTMVLLPLAPLATLIGVWLVRHVNDQLFYRITYGTMFLVAIKLCADALASLL